MLIKCCCCNVAGKWFIGVVLVIAGNSEYVIVIFWSLFGSVKICYLYRSVQTAAEKNFIILTLVRFLPIYEILTSPVLNIFIIRLTSLWCFYCVSEQVIFSNLHISAKFCKNPADLTEFQRAKSWVIIWRNVRFGRNVRNPCKVVRYNTLA